MNILPVFRILIGALFILSGFQKLISPYQNFLYVIQSYQVVGAPVDVWLARFLPWVEFVLGIFTTMGLWTKKSLTGLFALVIIFIGTLLQAVLRELPIEECGCFGEGFSLPIETMIVVDTAFLVIMAVLLKNVTKTARWSLDERFQ